VPTNTPSPPTNTPIPPTATPTASDGGLLIFDNDDNGFSATYAEDAWQTYISEGGQHFGDSHVFNRQVGSGTDVATWSFSVPAPGVYAVYAWWWEGSWRPTDVPYTISHVDGSTTVRVNQQVSGGKWNLYAFIDAGSVSISDDVSSGRDVVADAIALAYAGPLVPTNTPVPPTDTPTATLDPSQTMTLTLQIVPQGRGLEPSPKWEMPLFITLTTPYDGPVQYTFSGTCSAAGTITITGIPQATYDVFVSGDTTLVNVCRAQPLGAGSHHLYMGTLYEGDTNMDGNINILDLSRVAIAYGQTEGSPDYDRQADSNKDGVVSILDLSLVATNYGQEGNRMVTSR